MDRKALSTNGSPIGPDPDSVQPEDESNHHGQTTALPSANVDEIEESCAKHLEKGFDEWAHEESRSTHPDRNKSFSP